MAVIVLRVRGSVRCPVKQRQTVRRRFLLRNPVFLGYFLIGFVRQRIVAQLIAGEADGQRVHLMESLLGKPFWIVEIADLIGDKLIDRPLVLNQQRNFFLIGDGLLLCFDGFPLHAFRQCGGLRRCFARRQTLRRWPIARRRAGRRLRGRPAKPTDHWRC